MDEQLEQDFRRVLAGFPDAYPARLVAGYPRIARELVNAWGSEQFDSYLQSLLIDDRGDRQGFPPEVAEELLVLMRVSDKQRNIVPDPTPDIWGHGDAHLEFRTAQPQFTPQMLLEAALRGDAGKVDAMIRAHVPVDRTDELGKSPLIWAASYGHAPVVSLLLAAGANAELGDQGGYRAVHWACSNGHLDALDVLLGFGVQLNVPNRRGDTPLMLAAHALRVPLVQRLLASGVDVAAQDEAGNTALHQVLLFGRGAALLATLKLLSGVADRLHDVLNQQGESVRALAQKHDDPVVRTLLG